MSITYYELKALVEEARPLIEGRTLLAVKDGGHLTFVLVLEGEHPRVLRLLISVQPDLDRIHLTPRPSPKKNKVPATRFARDLHQRLQGMELDKITLENKDRVVGLVFKKEKEPPLRLVAELFGRHANLFLLDGDMTILEALKETHGKWRTLKRGGVYSALPMPHSSKRTRKQRFSAATEVPMAQAPLNSAADQFFWDLEWESRFKALKAKVLKTLARRRKKEGKKLSLLHEQLIAAQNAHQVKEKADLLQANFHLLKRGMDQIVVNDFISGSGKDVTIPLNPAKTPSENIAGLYKRYKKLAASAEHTNKLIRTSQDRIQEVRDLEEKVPLMEDWDALEKAAIRIGIQKKEKRSPKKPQEKTSHEARRFMSSDNFVLLAGKGGVSNDRLTFRKARGNDTWLHCQGAAGSHVVIQGEKNKSIPLSTLIEAGLIAKHFSKRRDADSAEVIYTQKKYVRKIKGGPPGKVIVERHKTLNIHADPKLLEKILNTAKETS